MPVTGQPKGPNVFTDPSRQAAFLATQLQSTGYFQLADDEALVLTIKPGKARYFSVPVTNDWTITDNYWDQPTSLNVSQAVEGPAGTYTIVVSPTDPLLANWVSTGGLNQGTIAIRFQDFDPLSSVEPTVSSQVVKLTDLSGLPTFTPRTAASPDRPTPTGLQPALHALPAGLEFQQRGLRLLDQATQIGEKRRRLRPVGDAVVEGACQRHRRPGHHRVVDHHRPRLQ